MHTVFCHRAMEACDPDVSSASKDPSFPSMRAEYSNPDRTKMKITVVYSEMKSLSRREMELTLSLFLSTKSCSSRMHKPAKKNNPFPQRQWRKYADDSRPILYPPVVEMLSQCSKRAKAVSYKARMASTEYWDASAWSAPDMPSLSVKKKWLRRLLGVFVCMPLAIIFSMTLFGEVVKSGAYVDVWLSEAVWFSMMGCLVWLVLVFGRMFTDPFLYWYVLGHELTHALAVILSFGKVSGFHAALEGGHVQTNKNNLFIALSPYFIPLWALVWSGIYALLNLFWPLGEWQSILYGGIGFWWAFHLYWTGWIIPKDQPDLKENETFFSLMIVYLANLVLLAGMLMLCGLVNFHAFWDGFELNSVNMWNTLHELLGWLAGIFR